VHLSSAAVLYVPGGQSRQVLVTVVPFVVLVVVTTRTVPAGHVLHCEAPGGLNAFAPTQARHVDTLVAPTAVEKVTARREMQHSALVTIWFVFAYTGPNHV
jgi:hypothetical protein